MPRIAGVDIPDNKRVDVSLTYIYGVGPKVSKDILTSANINPTTKTKDLTDKLMVDNFNWVSRLLSLLLLKKIVEYEVY